MWTTMSWQGFAILSAVFEPFTLKAAGGGGLIVLGSLILLL